jgi:nucleotide-binding universal stress UspA family protein
VERDPRWSSLYDAEVSAADASVRAIVERLTQAGVSASSEVAVTLAGRGAGAIDEAADEFDADLLVIATRTSGLFGLLGSRLARRLIRSSSRPVLLIPNRRQPGRWSGSRRPPGMR